MDRRASIELRPLEGLLQDLQGVAHASGSPEDPALAGAIQLHGAAAIPHVLPLLEADDSRIRRMAEFVVRDLEGLEESHLELLIRADSRSDSTWLPPAIARIGTPRAIAYLVDRLWRDPEIGNQLGIGLELSASKSAPEIVRRLSTVPAGDESIPDVVCELFSRVPDAAATALPGLVEMASDAELSMEHRGRALRLIGCFGAVGNPHQSAIRAIGERNAALASVSQQALLNMGAADALAAALFSSPSVETLRDIAGFGASARDVGPNVVPLIENADWEVRLAAIRTVGFIDFTDGTPALVRALEIQEDWRAVFAAAESLGRLKAASASEPLEAVAARHWYPPVRLSAEKALRVISGTDRYCPRWHRRNFALEFHEIGSRADVPPPGRLPALRRSRGEIGQRGRWFRREREAQVGLLAFGGALLGFDAGEWGGGLIYAAGSRRMPILDENTTGIHRVGSTIVAVTGLAHLTMDDGVLYRVERSGRGAAPSAVRWRQLPGAPYESGLLGDGRLFIRTHAGDVVLSPDGELAMYPD